MPKARSVQHDPENLAGLRNIGTAMLADFELLKISSVSQLALQDADVLYFKLCELTGTRQDPCVHDTFAAAIHQANTGEAQNWWAFTQARKLRQKRGELIL